MLNDETWGVGIIIGWIIAYLKFGLTIKAFIFGLFSWIYVGYIVFTQYEWLAAAITKAAS